MKGPRPPRLARGLLRLRPLGTRRAEVDADLDEAFAERVARQGRRRAARRYYRDVLSLWTWNLSGRRLAARRGAGSGLRPARLPPEPGRGRDHACSASSLAIAVSTVGVQPAQRHAASRHRRVGPRHHRPRDARACKDGIATSWTYADYLTLREHARMPIEASLGDGARFTTSPALGAEALATASTTPASACGCRSSARATCAYSAPARCTGASCSRWTIRPARPGGRRELRLLGAPARAPIPSVVGRQIWLNGVPTTIVGVARDRSPASPISRRRSGRRSRRITSLYQRLAADAHVAGRA